MIDRSEAFKMCVCVYVRVCVAVWTVQCSTFLAQCGLNF